MTNYICFNCSKNINTEKCPHCGYEFSIGMTCPRRLYDGIVCANTRKICKFRGNYEECDILKSE